jgi:hypothetical protein
VTLPLISCGAWLILFAVFFFFRFVYCLSFVLLVEIIDLEIYCICASRTAMPHYAQFLPGEIRAVRAFLASSSRSALILTTCAPSAAACVGTYLLHGRCP